METKKILLTQRKFDTQTNNNSIMPRSSSFHLPNSLFTIREDNNCSSNQKQEFEFESIARLSLSLPSLSFRRGQSSGENDEDEYEYEYGIISSSARAIVVTALNIVTTDRITTMMTAQHRDDEYEYEYDEEYDEEENEEEQLLLAACSHNNNSSSSSSSSRWDAACITCGTERRERRRSYENPSSASDSIIRSSRTRRNSIPSRSVSLSSFDLPPTTKSLFSVDLPPTCPVRRSRSTTAVTDHSNTTSSRNTNNFKAVAASVA